MCGSYWTAKRQRAAERGEIYEFLWTLGMGMVIGWLLRGGR